MPPVSSARTVPPSRDLAAVVRPPVWGRRPAPAPVVVLLFGHAEPEALEGQTRLLKTVLPHVAVLACGDPGLDRSVRVRRLFGETDADAYVLADDIGDPLAIARAVVAVERDQLDLVAVTPLELPGDAPQHPADRLLGRVLDYLFGCGARHVASTTRVCSRRFARSYAGDGTLRDLTLHALRLRMPVGEVASLDMAGRPIGSRRRDPGTWIDLGRLLARLFAEERPRRTFGLVGIASMAGGIATTLPATRVHDWHATLPSDPLSVVPLGLIALGAGAVGAGLLLDTLAEARQDVRRLGYLAIPRRADEAQSSVS